MKLILYFLLVCSFIAPQAVMAGEMRELEMTDGSVLTGEVISLAEGVYTVKSPSLGVIRIEESKIRSIRTKSTADGRSSSRNADTGGEKQKLQDKMLSNKEIMNKIMALQNDPDFLKILDDPELMQAVESGDIAALTRNQNFLKLLDNATVRDIETMVQEPSGSR